MKINYSSILSQLYYNTDFLKKKCSNFCSLFVIIYGIIYILSVLLISNASFNFDDFPDLMFMQMFAGMISLILSFIILGMEINRLGIGALFEVIGVCISRISENNKEM